MKKYLLSVAIVLTALMSSNAQDSLYLAQGTFFVNHSVEYAEAEGDILFRKYTYLYTREQNDNTGAYAYNIYRIDETTMPYTPNWVGDINFTLADEPDAEFIRAISLGDSALLAMYFRDSGGEQSQQFGRYFYAQTPTEEDPDKGAKYLQSDDNIDIDISFANFIHITTVSKTSYLIEKRNADIIIKKIGIDGGDNIMSRVMESNEDVLEAGDPIKRISFSNLTADNIVSLTDGIIVIGQGSILATIDISNPAEPEIVAQAEFNFTLSELKTFESLYAVSRSCCSEPQLYLLNAYTAEVLSSIELNTSELISVGPSNNVYAVRLGSSSIDAYKYRVDNVSDVESGKKLVLDAKGTNLKTENFGFPTGKALLAGGSLTAGIIFDRGDSYPAGYINVSIVETDQSSTSAELWGNEAVKDYQLLQNYPNPFNPSTKIEFSIPVSSVVKVTVFDMLGRAVATLNNEMLPAGFHSVDFNASDLSSGVYLYTIEAGDFIQTKKMTLLK